MHDEQHENVTMKNKELKLLHVKYILVHHLTISFLKKQNVHIHVQAPLKFILKKIILQIPVITVP